MQINTILIQLIRFSEKTATEEDFQLQPMETVFRCGLVFCSSKERNNLFGVVLPSSSSFHALIAPFLDIFYSIDMSSSIIPKAILGKKPLIGVRIKLLQAVLKKDLTSHKSNHIC